jgi:hypothetical protein
LARLPVASPKCVFARSFVKNSRVQASTPPTLRRYIGLAAPERMGPAVSALAPERPAGQVLLASQVRRGAVWEQALTQLPQIRAR